MRKLFVILGAVLVLSVANIGIWQKQQLVDSGRVVILELAPVDPRSLMQGDYMALRFKVMTDAFSGVSGENVADGRIVVSLDERNVGTFVRLDNGAALAPNEAAIRYRERDGGPRFSTNAYFFQEGTAEIYAPARYGEFRVSSGGDAILTRLRDAGLEPLGPRPQ